MDRHRRQRTAAPVQRRGPVQFRGLRIAALPLVQADQGAPYRRRRRPVDRNQERRHPAHPRFLRLRDLHPEKHAQLHDSQFGAPAQRRLCLCPESSESAVDRHRRRRQLLLLCHRTDRPADRPEPVVICACALRGRRRHPVGRHGRTGRLPHPSHGIGRRPARRRDSPARLGRKCPEEEFLLLHRGDDRRQPLVLQPRSRGVPLRPEKRPHRGDRVRSAARASGKRRDRHGGLHRQYALVRYGIRHRLLRPRDRVRTAYAPIRERTAAHRGDSRDHRRLARQPLGKHQRRDRPLHPRHEPHRLLRRLLRTGGRGVQRRRQFLRPPHGPSAVRRQQRIRRPVGNAAPRRSRGLPPAHPVPEPAHRRQ